MGKSEETTLGFIKFLINTPFLPKNQMLLSEELVMWQSRTPLILHGERSKSINLLKLCEVNLAKE